MPAIPYTQQDRKRGVDVDHAGLASLLRARGT